MKSTKNSMWKKMPLIIGCLVMLDGMLFAGPQKETPAGGSADSGSSYEQELSFSPISITDTEENEIVINKPLERIVVAYYGCAEVMRSLDAANLIVGVGETITSRPAYFPELSALPATGKTSFNEAEKILKLNPDAVIIGIGSRNGETREKLLSINPDMAIIQMAFYKPEYHVEEVEKLAKILRKKPEADKYLDFYTGVLDVIAGKVDSIPLDKRPRVYLESTQDYKTGAPGSSWHPKILTAGGFNVYGDEKVSLPEVTAESVLKKNPEIIYKVSGWNMKSFGGYGVDSYDEMMAEKERIIDRPAWSNISAVQNDRVWIMYNDVLGGPGYFIGVAYLAKTIYPDMFADLDPAALHQEYLTQYQKIDFDLSKRGVFIFPRP